MFSRDFSLKNEKEIKNIYKKGNSVFDSVCGIKFIESSGENPRFAIVVGKKVSKLAVDRNKIRRQYKAILKEFLPNFSKNADIILIVSKPSLEMSFNDKKERLEKVLKKGGFI